ncbi:hypothetical protein NLU13_0981 [Sarocladium strictum]|uniref:Peptidase M20 dimerisation domain-containing protein n=1 Tax=Sarocladium strictum TaxID=5046 RepID=A0AA39GQ34_SARSR|nr:hypothetical protein NLU13_0981 [Sarocladium strictum]
MVLQSTLSLFAAATAASAFVASPLDLLGQLPLGSPAAGHSSVKTQCELPPVLSPGGDGLPSSKKLFTTAEALEKQVERHQAVVRVPSVCFDDLGSFETDKRWAPFYDLHEVLAKTYPVVHKRSKLEKVNKFGLVYTIEGSDSSLKPILLAAHQDVVPVADESTWTHPPFDAYWDGEWLWGRGSSDDKNSLTAVMSALETLLSNEDWQPRRTIIAAFGFDEECSGYRGAGKIGPVLEERYGENGIALVLDEGGLGITEMGNALYALPAVMEKGHVDVWFELHVTGGHSSAPFPHTGIGIMSEIVKALEDHPYEASLNKEHPFYNHMQCQARYSPDAIPEVTKLVEKDDLEGLTKFIASQFPLQFLVQTSQAVDFISGGQKINAMPEVTTLGVNYRVAPHDSVPKVQHNVVKHISDVVEKFDLKVVAFEGDEDFAAFAAENQGETRGLPTKVDYNGTLVLSVNQVSHVSPKSPTEGPVWDVFSGTIQHVFAYDGVVVPVGEIMTGNTDTRHYLKLTPNIYRFTPGRITGMENIHTINERVRMDDHMEMVRFYYDFVRNCDASDF